MADQRNGVQTRDVIGVIALGAVALGFAILLAVGLPFLSKVDPTSPNVMKHRLREAFCEPRIHHRVECLQECALDQGDDYQDGACEQLPRDNPTPADQERLEAELYTRSPCASECQTNWKTHSVWYAQGIEKAKLDGIDACIFEGATIALFDFKEARCLERCPDADPDGDLYLTSRDTCMISCMVATMVAEPDPEDARRVRFFLTAHARNIREDLMREVTAAYGHATHDVSPDELDACLTTLRKVLANLQHEAD